MRSLRGRLMSTFQGQGPCVSASLTNQPVTPFAREKNRRIFRDFWTLFIVPSRTFKMSISPTYSFLGLSSNSPPAFNGNAFLGHDRPPSRRLASGTASQSSPEAYESSVWAASPSKVVAYPRTNSPSHLTPAGTALSQLEASPWTIQSNLKRKRPQPRQSSKGLRGRYGCRTCRQRHLKCDEVRPTCENCVKAKRDCLWNHEIRMSHDHRSSASTTNNSNLNSAHPERPARKFVSASASKRSVCSVTPLDRHRQNLETVTRNEHGECLANVTEPVGSPRGLLTFALEAQLFQFYVEHAGPWLDITSPSLHFASTTPRLALSNPVLLFACLAYAARAIHSHCSLSEQYSGACVKLLIPLLSDEGFVGSDETLLATLVILRHVEQYTEAPQDQAAHLSGAFSLVALRPEPPPRDSLPGAALWTYMRQDIRQALLNRAPPKLKPSHGIRLDNFDADGGESSWADRACHLAALACTFAWGDTEDEVNGSYLSGLLDWWVDNLPQVYYPYHESESSVRFLSRWHGMYCP